MELEVRGHRGWFAIYAGQSKLSKSYRSREAAEKELEESRSFYRYWAGSAVVSVENTEPVIIVAGGN
jgi:hypothetical protein